MRTTAKMHRLLSFIINSISIMNSKLLFGSCLLLSVCSVHAQDTIFKRNNETVIAKVLEITQTEVKYKRYNYLDGPLYIESKSEIKQIRFKGGATEEFKLGPQPAVIYNYFTIPANNQRIEIWAN